MGFLTKKKTVVLGPEYDDDLLIALRCVARELGGKLVSKRHLAAGSQNLTSSKIQIGIQRIVVERETYVGLSIRGPADLVERIAAMVREARGESGTTTPE